MAGVTSDARVRIRYAETDKMGVAYHANYLVWFEVGRVELLRKLGFNYRDLEHKHDCHLPVVDVRCRYKSPAFYDDELIIRTRLKAARSSFLQFAYEVVRSGDDIVLAEGETTHIVVNSKMEKTSLPESYASALAAAVGK
jgi:acyl-CoA thioester hydrolase